MNAEQIEREWLRGCSCATPGRPWECVQCTNAMRKAMNEVTQAGKTLADQGMRFILRRANGTVVLSTWIEAEFMQPGDVDCTDMTDEEFEREVTR